MESLTSGAGACLRVCCVSAVEGLSILNWIMLNFKQMSGQARGGGTATMSIFLYTGRM